MMNTIFRLSKLYVFAVLFIYMLDLKSVIINAETNSSLPTSGVLTLNMECNSALAQWNELRNKVSDKCSGTGIQNCFTEAVKCNENTFSPNQDGASGILSTIAPAIGSSLGFPLQPMVGGLSGGANSEFFKCLPTIKREKYEEQLRDMKEDAQRASDKIKDTKMKYDEQLSDIRKQIAEKRDEAVNALKEAQSVMNKEKSAKEKMKAGGNESWDKVLEEIESMDSNIDKLRSEIDSYETSLQDLYYNIFANPETSCVTIYEKKMDEGSLKIKDSNKESLLKINSTDDLYGKEILMRSHKNYSKFESENLRKRLYKEYGACLETKKFEYQNKYRRISSTITSLKKGIDSSMLKRDKSLEKLKEIRSAISTAVKELEDENRETVKNAQIKLKNTQEDIKNIATDYQKKIEKTELEYNQKEINLQLIKTQRAGIQAVFQMTAFGDAAPLVNLMNTARSTACLMCPNLKKEKGMCSNFEYGSDPFSGKSEK